MSWVRLVVLFEIGALILPAMVGLSAIKHHPCDALGPLVLWVALALVTLRSSPCDEVKICVALSIGILCGLFSIALASSMKPTWVMFSDGEAFALLYGPLSGALVSVLVVRATNRFGQTK